MAKKIQIGDIFIADLDENRKKYFQYIANDLSQLNSDVIKVFLKTYQINDNPDLSVIIKDETEFYVHCVIKWGIKLGFWKKVGKIPDIGKVEVLFRSTDDEPRLAISNKWWIWRINEEAKYIGKLEGENIKAEIGSVIPPDSILYRMRNGRYDFVYPAYE